MIDRRRLTVLVGVGVALAAGGIVFAALVLTTSGPFASNDDNGDASATPPAVTLTATPTEAPDPEVTPTPEPHVLEVDADGWPIVICPDDWEHRKSDLLRATFCAPPGWLPSEWRDLPYDDSVTLELSLGTQQAATFRVTFVSRATTPDGSAFDLPCEQPAPRSVATIRGMACLRFNDDPDDVAPLFRWRIDALASTPSMWIRLVADGVSQGSHRVEMLATIDLILDHLAWDGGDRVYPELAPRSLEVDADGWPVVECPEGWEHRRASLSRTTLCIPPGWKLLSEFEQVLGDPPYSDAVSLILQSDRDGLPPTGVQVTLYSRAVKPSDQGLNAHCRHLVRRPIAGLPGQFCLGFAEEQNGISVYPLYGWEAHGFAPARDEWVVLNAAGPELGPDRDAILALVDTILDHIVWDGGERVGE